MVSYTRPTRPSGYTPRKSFFVRGPTAKRPSAAASTARFSQWNRCRDSAQARAREGVVRSGSARSRAACGPVSPIPPAAVAPEEIEHLAQDRDAVHGGGAVDRERRLDAKAGRIGHCQEPALHALVADAAGHGAPPRVF